MVASSFSDEEVRQGPTISSHQLAAAATPGLSTSDLLGNFGDFAKLFDELKEPVLIELGNPLPKPNICRRGASAAVPLRTTTRSSAIRTRSGGAREA